MDEQEGVDSPAVPQLPGAGSIPAGRVASPLPTLLAGWVEGLIGKALPPETRANCSHCTMCDPSESGEPAEVSFLPEVKCCTFVPALPNYAVGMILESTSAADATARREVERRIRSNLAATPWKLESSRRTRVQYMKIQREDLFGRTESLVCPYWIRASGGKCGIWPYRTATCATWFCRHSQYAAGRRFWAELSSTLNMLEDAIASHCLLEVGLDPDCLVANHDNQAEGRQLALGEFQGWQDPDGWLHPALEQRLWGSFREKKIEYYLACARLARALSWRDVQAICGVRLAVMRARLRASLAELGDTKLPERLCLTDIKTEPGEEGMVQISSAEMGYESLELDRDSAAALSLFDGRPTEEVMREARKKGAALDEALIRRLFEQGVLAKVGHDLSPRDRHHTAISARTRLFFFRDFRASSVHSELCPGEDGAPVLHLHCGPKRIVFSDPDLFEFARKLLLFQNGFYAGDAIHWGPPGITYSWKRVRAILDTLIAEDILQALGPEES